MLTEHQRDLIAITILMNWHKPVTTLDEYLAKYKEIRKAVEEKEIEQNEIVGTETEAD